MAPPWMRVSDRLSQRSLRSLRMVCAETSKRRARSSTITRPKARAILRISFWRWVRPVMTTPWGPRRSHGGAVPASGQRARSAAKAGRWRKAQSWLRRAPALLMRGGGGLLLFGFGQALRDMSGAVPRQHLGFFGLMGAFALPDLLGAAFFRGFAIFRRHRIWVDQFLRESRGAKNRSCNQGYVEK